MRKLVVLLCFVSGALVAQDFAIKRIELQGADINIYYDLVDTLANRTYTVTIFSSKDSFISPMAKINGDVGLEVKPGKNKKIVWHAKEELGATFEGNVSIEVRGRLYIPFVKLDQLPKKMKRLKSHELTWTGGTPQNILNFELFKNGEKVNAFPNIANVGHYTLKLPSNVKAGKDYYFKITDTKNKDQVVITPSFAVKRKLPLLVKALLFAGVGSAAAVAVGAGGSSGSPSAPPIEEAPGRPGN